MHSRPDGQLGDAALKPMLRPRGGPPSRPVVEITTERAAAQRADETASGLLVEGSIRRDQVWILEVAGKRLVIEACEQPGQSAADKAEVQGILDSIRIAPIN